MWRARFGSAVVSLWVAVLTQGAAGAALAGAAPAPLARRVAEVRHVVLLDPPRALERALHTALSPWGVRLRSVARERPGSTLPGSALSAGQLARELGAQTLVWCSSGADGAALWIYDAGSDTIRARVFPDRPMDGALAAALALSVKTWLRSTESEAAPAALQAAELPAAPLPVAARHEPPAPEAVALEDSVAVRPAHPPALRALASAAARRGTLQDAAAEARYGAELRVSAWSAETARTQLWLGARFETGSALAVSRPALRGTYSDHSGGVFVGLEQRLTPLLAAGLYGGAALHRTALSGALPPADTPVETVRWLVSAQLRPELELGLGPLGVVLQGAIGVPLRKQVYRVDAVEMAGAGSVWWTLGGGLRLDIL
jgi:hypothetical protein